MFQGKDKPQKGLSGSAAEQMALEFLQARGLTLSARNFRTRRGEIDLIMLDNKVLVFVEVRFRRSPDFGTASASVTRRKQVKIISTARHFLLHNPKLAALPCRFDVVGITLAAQNITRFNWIQDAFC